VTLPSYAPERAGQHGGISEPMNFGCLGYPFLVATTNAADYIPDSRELSVLAEAARDCRGCGLYREANQTVFWRWPIVGADDARR
jgi:hypothetical protein